MKNSFLAMLTLLSALALAGCGENPSIEKSRAISKGGQASNKGNAPTPRVDETPNAQTNSHSNARPPLPPEVLGRYAEDFNQSLEFTDLHLGRWNENTIEDTFDQPFSAAGADATMFFHERDQIPFTGWVKAWHPNDALGVLCRFKNGIRHGEMLQWYPNGKLQIQGFYAEGNPVDTWYYWDKEGNETQPMKFENGLRVDP